MARIIGRNAPHDEGTHWLSVSDLMAGLMVIFLFIAISYMQLPSELARRADSTRAEIYRALQDEFAQDLKQWDASLDRETLTLEFHAPNVLFGAAEFRLREPFKRILDDFIPRYLSVLAPFREDIAEIRIEGHTSSLWEGADTKTEAYFENMRLSQRRTRSVLRYIYDIGAIETAPWVAPKIAAIGFSSSHPVLDDGKEDLKASRRVAFRVRTDFEQALIREAEAATP